MNPPNKALQATAAVLLVSAVVGSHNAVVAGASAPPAAVPELLSLGDFATPVNAIDVILVVVGVACLVVAIVFAGQALERRKARQLALALLGRTCPHCGSAFRRDAIRSARLDFGFEDDDITIVCPDCSKTVTLYEKDNRVA